jgi:hypothetical protein
MTNLERQRLNLKVVFMFDVVQSEVVRSMRLVNGRVRAGTERVRTGDSDTSRTV